MLTKIKTISSAIYLIVFLIILGVTVIYYSNKYTELEGHVRTLEAGKESYEERIKILENNIMNKLEIVSLCEQK